MAKAADVKSGEATARPMNGAEYLESLRDGRKIWIYGERVDDVTTHPAFRNGARSVARLYNALHDPAHEGRADAPRPTRATAATRTRSSGRRTSAEDLVAGRDAIAAWQRLTYGWMGRSPDYKAAFLATYGPNADYYAPFEENARRWYKEAQERVLLHEPHAREPAGRPRTRTSTRSRTSSSTRSRRPTRASSSAARRWSPPARRSRTTTSSPTTASSPIKKEEYALSFFAPMDHPNIKLMCRPSYEFMAATVGSPFDYPLSSRFDENDAVLMFEDALIPWENFLIYGNLEIASTYHLTGFIWRALMQGCTRLAVKLDFLAGVFIKAVEATGTIEFRGIQAVVGEILAWRHTFWALTDAMCHNPVPVGGRARCSRTSRRRRPTGSSRTRPIPKIKGIIENQTGGALIVRPSQRRDWKDAELRPLLDQFYRGSNGYDGRVEKIKLVNLLWDSIGSEFGGRHELYERTYSGSHELTRLECYWMAQGDGTVDRMKGFAEQCMAEYDLDGWTVHDLVNPDDINAFGG